MGGCVGSITSKPLPNNQSQDAENKPGQGYSAMKLGLDATKMIA